ncbi:MAG TPA: biopolymer transporter ExbD [bacterium]|nr:biopolymer transporter ExbD [bacterium]
MQGAANKHDDPVISEMNVAPLVDICLVLVIIFMVTSPMVIQSGIIVNSSTVTAEHGKTTRDEAISVKVTSKGYYVNNRLYDADNFISALKPVIDKSKKKTVMITSDRDVNHGALVWVLDTSKMLGALSIAIMREEKKKK